MSDSKTTSTGIGFPGLLTAIFITLKLCKVIDWSWKWVLAPIWIPLAILFVIGVIFMIVKIIQHFTSK